ncbi:hypothetical protein N7539_002251 [Penicillium diatomitis]|uniref:Uncharacterized protein n=1 Tax=Penicillium diatomitis TaxID=2819901 RepID=A0A9W9XJ51_9EURO|nr:uncharacterized protein N7539_002251 [Penicillium diatomitis]KAJ5493505.1 hypothetical protein N7539_002251 [Penicillium diatomitis]
MSTESHFLLHLEHESPVMSMSPWSSGDEVEGKAYTVIQILSDNHNLYYSVWCTNEHELYDLSIRGVIKCTGSSTGLTRAIDRFLPDAQCVPNQKTETRMADPRASS